MVPFLPNRKRYARHGHISAKEKLAAVQRINNGESKASVARNIDVPESTLRGWCKNAERLHFIAEKFVDEKESFPTNILSTNKQIERNGVQKSLVSNEPSKNDYKIGKSSNAVGVLDLSNSAKQLQESQCYGLFQSNGWTSPSFNFTQLDNRAAGLTSSAPELKNYQHNGLCKPPYAISVGNATIDTRYFYPNQQSIRSDNHFAASATPSSVVPNPTSHSSRLSLPSSVNPSIASTPQAFSPTLPDSILLWQSKDLNRSLIERMADKSPTAAGEPDSILVMQSKDLNRSPIEKMVDKSPTAASDFKFNTNISTPESLTILPIFRPNTTKREQAVVSQSTTKYSPKSKPASPTIDQRHDALSNKLLNLNNNNYVAVHKESDTDIVGPSEAIQYAEKFSKWFESYSDPTITTQDVLRFENLLEKVRNIVKRKTNAIEQSSKVHRRK